MSLSHSDSVTSCAKCGGRRKRVVWVQLALCCLNSSQIWHGDQSGRYRVDHASLPWPTIFVTRMLTCSLFAGPRTTKFDVVTHTGKGCFRQTATLHFTNASRNLSAVADFYRAKLCVSVVSAVARCPSVCSSVHNVGAFYPDR